MLCFNEKIIMAKGTSKKGSSDFGKKGWEIVLISIVYFYLASAVTSDGANTINAIMQQKFGLADLAPLTLGQTLGGWLTIVTVPFFTKIANKYGAKITIIISLVIFIACTYLIFNPSSLLVYQIAVTLACATIVGFQIVGTGMLGANWFPTKKGLYMGWATFGIPISAATVNLMMQQMMNKMPFGSIAWVFIVVALIAIVLTLLVVKNNPEEAGAFPDNDQSMTAEKAKEIAAEAEELKRTSPWTTKKVLHLKETWMISFGWGIMMMGAGGIISQFVAAGMSWGHPLEYPIKLLTVMFPVGIFFSWFIGFIDDKWGTKAASLFVCGMLIFGAVVAGIWGANAVALAIGGGCFMGAMSGGNNLTMSVTGTKFGRFDFNNAWAVISMLTKIIGAAGIVGVSLLARSFGYSGAYLIVAGTVAVAAVIIAKTDLTCVGRISADQ